MNQLLQLFCIALSLKLTSVAAAPGIIDLFLHNPDLDSSGRAASNIVYYGVYYIGTPARRFLGCFDTGSGDVWLPSSSCTTDVCRSHDQYDPAASSTSSIPQNAPTTISINYGTGEIIASKVADTMSFAGFQIPTQYFGAASQLSSDFSLLSCDGLVGLAFPGMSHLRYNPPFINAGSAGLLPSNIFGIFLNPQADVEPAGSISLGQVETSKFTGQLTALPITKELYWTVSLSGYSLGTQSFAPSVDTAILDCGTTAIFLPQADANAINNAIPTSSYWAAQDIWNVSCDYTQMPNLVFSIGGSNFALPPSLYVQQLSTTSGRGLGICASAIIGGQSRVILGTNFLRAWYTKYDWGSDNQQATVSLAPAVGVIAGSDLPTTGRRLSLSADKRFDINVLHKRHYDSFDQPRWGWVAPARRDHNYKNAGAQLQ